MVVYRLAREKFAGELSGKGAAIKGARWNSIGAELIYTAANRSLAMAEVAVHLTLATVPDDYMMVSVFIPDDISLTEIDETALPEYWNNFPHHPSSQAFGDQFITENKSCILKIPSAVTKGDFNLLINPNHPEFKKIRIIAMEKFPFDKRIFR